MYTAYKINPIYGQEYFLVIGEDFFCEQLVKKSKNQICIIDKKLREIYWFKLQEDFIVFLEIKKNRREEHLIDIDFEDYIQFLFGIFTVDDRFLRCN